MTWSKSCLQSGVSVRVGSRRGFTLVELMLSLMLFSTAILALVATGSSVIRMTSGTRQFTLAATVGQSRLERLRSLGCSAGAMASGTATTRTITERWTVTSLVGADGSLQLRLLVDSLSYPDERGVVKRQVYSTVRPCP